LLELIWQAADNARVETLTVICGVMSLDDALVKAAAWRMYYNENRSHSTLDWSKSRVDAAC